MAETQQQAEDRLRASYPPPQVVHVNGADVAMTTEEYDAWITASATNEIAAQLAAEQEEALRELRRQVRITRTRLQQIRDATGTFTNAQRDAAIKDVARYLDGLIGALIDLNLIDREG